MHNAPSVSYPAGRSRLAGWLLLGVWLLGWAALLLWQREAPGGSRLGVMFALLVVFGAFAALQWWRTPSGTLDWNGTRWAWSCQPHADATGVDVAVDLQRALLLHWISDCGSRWIWLERSGHPQRWDDLRRAIYSRARPPALPQAEPPAAKP